MTFLYLVTGYKNFFDQNEIKKMSLSVQHSVVESFKFNGKNIRVIHIKNVGQCFVGIDVSEAIGYNDDDNARRAVRTHVLGKYRMRLGDAQNILRREVDIDLPKEDTVLLKEPGLYCFPLRRRKKREKNCGHKYWLFLCLVTGYKNFLTKNNYE